VDRQKLPKNMGDPSSVRTACPVITKQERCKLCRNAEDNRGVK
jgi:hypothetical protein